MERKPLLSQSRRSGIWHFELRHERTEPARCWSVFLVDSYEVLCIHSARHGQFNGMHILRRSRRIGPKLRRISTFSTCHRVDRNELRNEVNPSCACAPAPPITPDYDLHELSSCSAAGARDLRVYVLGRTDAGLASHISSVRDPDH